MIAVIYENPKQYQFIYRWSYRDNDPTIRRLGPILEIENLILFQCMAENKNKRYVCSGLSKLSYIYI